MGELEVLIRQASVADVPAIVELNDALFQEDAGQHDRQVNLAWAREHGHSYFANLIAEPQHACFLASAGGVAVGYLAARMRPPGDYRPVATAELESIFVRGAWRSRQVGAALVETFFTWARERGAVRVFVTAFAANDRAISFYERAGFTPYHLTLARDL